MIKLRFKDNPYGKNGDIATKQIIDRILAQNFGIGKKEGVKSIDEMQSEMLKEINEKAKIVDFAKGEDCEFK